MEISLITYDAPHRKTEGIVEGIYSRGGRISKLIALPFVPRPNRAVIFQHRPDPSAARHPRELSRTYGIPFEAFADAASLQIDTPVALIGIGVLLPARLAREHRIVNCHAGLIPTVRGLDAFKWAVLEDKPLGVSLHYIDEDVDMGTHIASRRTPVIGGDTPESLSLRHYRLEIEMTVEFERYLAAPEEPFFPDRIGPPRKRMPAAMERQMIERFPCYVENCAWP